MVAGILFDLDGTLVDSFPGIRWALERAIAEVLPDEAHEVGRELIGPPLRTILRNLLGERDPEVVTQLERAFRSAYDSDGCLESVPYPGLLEVLQDLESRGWACFIVTNKPKRPTERLLAHLGLDRYFVEAVSLDSREPRFRDKIESGLDLVARHGLDPKRLLVVGDSEDDARLAEACGAVFVAATYGYGGASAPPGRDLREVSDLTRWISA